MSPSHLVEKWKREIERLVPNAKGYIIENIKELVALDGKIRNKLKKEHTFIVMSKENAKFSYESRPAAIWSKSKKCFVCPECGKRLFKEEWIGSGRGRYKSQVYLTHTDFTKEFAYNLVCGNETTIYDKKEKKRKRVNCEAKLWTPYNRFESKCKWVKLGKEGWFYKDNVMQLYADYMSRRSELNKKDQQLLVKLMEARTELENSGTLKSTTPGVRKYSIAKYIRENYKGIIDYFIADEVHELKGGNSLQGQALGDLSMASNKTIALTGTLLNGYADGLFYLLYRTMPQVMKADGFEYQDEALFQRAYGVIKRTNEYSTDRRGVRNRTKVGQEKRLPGVSPLTFTKFLLENAVFVSISDMAEGLPNYTEIPIPVDMDSDLKASYEALNRVLRENSSTFRSRNSSGESGGKKIMGLMLQALSTYPDMPYDTVPILHPDTGNIITTPIDLGEGLRNKEMRLIELIREKKAAGEKVLVYYEWTGKTDVADKIIAALKDENIKAYNLTAKTKAKEREAMIEKQIQEHDIDVLICNPALVKTGLDLLDFTTIVFYQMGYNIFTMRQASRRSWRLSQTKDIEVYFMFYRETIQEQAISLMASKLQASMALEGKFSEEGLRAMADNQDLLSQIASSVVEGIKYTVEADVFTSTSNNNNSVLNIDTERENKIRKALSELLVTEFVRAELSYLAHEAVKRKPTSTSKMINNIFSNKKTLSSLYKAY